MGSTSARVGAALLILLVFIAVFGPLITPHDPTAIEPLQALRPPSTAHLFGTDNLGRDLLSRVIAGARVSLSLAVITGLAAMLVGIVVGAISGYAGGWIDALLMRIVDVLLAFPSLILALAVAGTLGEGYVSLLIAMVLTLWARNARLIRGAVLAERSRPYVEASRGLGTRPVRVLWRHILPNVIWPFVVLLSLEMSRIILLVAALDYLGVGVQPPTPEWGTMVADARLYLFNAPWMIGFPGLAIALTVAAFNLTGEGLRDAVDPRT
ncbi:MAG: ABC transporter permease [Candidatus Dormibacteraeota bacterium]|nr:ABC transporter permease [Candidatus Dormibacteraeota bacterium]